MSTQTLDPAKSPVDGCPTGVALPGNGLHWSNGYKAGTYDAAKAGSVALIVLQGGMEQAGAAFRAAVDRMSCLGDMPSAIVVTADFVGSTSPAGTDAEFRDMFADLKAKYPKLSDNPAYHVVSGGSTAGAWAFDFVWQYPTLATKALAGSPALVCFMDAAKGTNHGYADLIAASPPALIRFSATVGQCDVMGTLEERIAAGCSNCTSAGCIDASQCAANYVTVNQGVNAALVAKSTPAQLLIVKNGAHDINTWASIYLNDRIRFLFADIVCN